MYLYDRGGNMTGYLSAPYTLAPTLDGVTEMVFYSYDDANWKDKVTAIGGKAITYDAIGNPLTYDGWTFTWKAGRMLASMVKTGTNAQFTYDHNGMRIRKVVNGVTTNYTLNGKNIVHMTQGSNDLHFFYDAQGKPAMVRFNGTDYFYVYNLQGDVVAMIDANGTQVVEYHYDAWGNPVAKAGSMAATLGTVNPFRYRGYIYDEETGCYLLEERYYNPLWKRFINADRILCREGASIEANAFAYCFNSPKNYSDYDGRQATSAIDLTKRLNDAMESHYREFQQYFKEHGFLKSVFYFIGKVRTGGDWDLKSQSDWDLSKDKEYVYNGTAIRSDEPGNIHFGYVGSVIFDAEMLQAGAGIYQIFSGTSAIEFYSSYFDDPVDSMNVMYGYLLKNGASYSFPGYTITLEEFEKTYKDAHK